MPGVPRPPAEGRPAPAERTHVVLDLGEVLVPAWDVASLAAAVGADPDRFVAAYWAHRGRYDRGSDPDEYWLRVAQDAAIPPGTLSEADVTRLAELDALHWTAILPEAEQLLAELNRAGVPLALLSNAPFPIAEAVRRQPWTEHFGQLVFSAEEGLTKPDPRIYERVTERLQVQPRQVVFFDDRPENVAAARRCRWNAHVWTGVHAARAVLDEYRVP
jgi:putative hydrolase of the HAD superfamily